MSIRANVDPRGADQRITFERDYGVPDASGDIPSDWRALSSCWARVDGAKGSELVAGGGITAQATYLVWVRAEVVKRLSITAKDRIRWAGRLLNIGDMPDQQLRGRWIVLACTTGVNAG
jgi:SPP1 family predicted phage head-tail adaptor